MRHRRGPLSESEKALRKAHTREFKIAHDERNRAAHTVVWMGDKYSVEELASMCKLTLKDGKICDDPA